MLIYEYFIDLWVLLAGRKEESLQRGIVVVVPFVTDLLHVNMHPIQYYLEEGLDRCMLLWNFYTDDH